jgi:hypothetical protein
MRGRRETGIRIGRVYLARLRALLFFARMDPSHGGMGALPAGPVSIELLL